MYKKLARRERLSLGIAIILLQTSCPQSPTTTWVPVPNEPALTGRWEVEGVCQGNEEFPLEGSVTYEQFFRFSGDSLETKRRFVMEVEFPPLLEILFKENGGAELLEAAREKSLDTILKYGYAQTLEGQFTVSPDLGEIHVDYQSGSAALDEVSVNGFAVPVFLVYQILPLLSVPTDTVELEPFSAEYAYAMPSAGQLHLGLTEEWAQDWAAQCNAASVNEALAALGPAVPVTPVAGGETIWELEGNCVGVSYYSRAE